MAKCLVLGCKNKGKYMATYADCIDIYYCEKHEFLFEFTFKKKHTEVPICYKKSRNGGKTAKKINN